MLTTLFEQMNNTQTLNYTANNEQLRDHYVHSILKHLETLLNVRRPTRTVELNDSKTLLLNYGLPDLSRFNPRANQDKYLLQNAIKATIVDYETRLQDVEVEILEDNDPLATSLHFKITAVANFNNENLLFYFEFNPVTHEASIREVQ